VRSRSVNDHPIDGEFFMKAFSVLVLTLALAGCAAEQGKPGDAQAVRVESCKA
jgi:hypothetical protein